MKNTDYISLMVQETLESTHLEESLRDFLVLRGHEDTQRKCLVIYNKMGDKLEIPKNWGPTKLLSGSELYLDSTNDQENFLGVLSAFCHENLTRVKILIADVSEKKAA